MTWALGGDLDLSRPAAPPERAAAGHSAVSEGRHALPRSMIVLTMAWLRAPGYAAACFVA